MQNRAESQARGRSEGRPPTSIMAGRGEEDTAPHPTCSELTALPATPGKKARPAPPAVRRPAQTQPGWRPSVRRRGEMSNSSYDLSARSLNCQVEQVIDIRQGMDF